jgi:hypothetical protein
VVPSSCLAARRPPDAMATRRCPPPLPQTGYKAATPSPRRTLAPHFLSLPRFLSRNQNTSTYSSRGRRRLPMLQATSSSSDPSSSSASQPWFSWPKDSVWDAPNRQEHHLLLRVWPPLHRRIDAVGAPWPRQPSYELCGELLDPAVLSGLSLALCSALLDVHLPRSPPHVVADDAPTSSR